MFEKPGILFEEKQSQPVYMRLGLPVAMIAIVIAVEIFDPEQTLGTLERMSVVAITVSIAILLTWPKLITRVDSEKVSLRRRFSIHAEILLTEISRVEERTYKDASKEHGSLWTSLPYFYIGEQGVIIHRFETKPTFVSSKRASELVALINHAREISEHSKYNSN